MSQMAGVQRTAFVSVIIGPSDPKSPGLTGSVLSPGRELMHAIACVQTCTYFFKAQQEALTR